MVAYVKNYVGGWKDEPLETTPILAACLDNIETQYDSALWAMAIDTNLSAACQDAISKRHTQNSDTHLGAQDQDLNMNTHKITGVVDPVANQDAATKLYVDSAMAGGGIPAGLVAMWYGLAANCPAGWHICDGTVGTPDLRGKFIKGAAVDAGGSGGAATHTHSNHTALSHSGCSVANHSAVGHSGCSVAEHAAQSHSGSAVGNHSSLTHSGCAVAPHTGNTGTPSATLAKLGTGPENVPTATHTHSLGTLTHTVTQADAHSVSAHSVSQPDAHDVLHHIVSQASVHPAVSHSVTQADNHSISAHSTASNEPVYYELCFIMKV